MNYKGLKDWLISVVWWDHTYSVDDEAEPDQLETFGLFNRVKSLNGKQYLMMTGERSKTDHRYKRHHYTILTDDIVSIDKIKKV